MTDFIRARHSKNHPDGRSSSTDGFYDFFEGIPFADAWIARLTNEDMQDFQQSFLVRYTLSIRRPRLTMKLVGVRG